MSNIDELLKQSQPNREPKPGYHKAIMDQIVPRRRSIGWMEFAVATCVILSLILTLASLFHSNLDLLYRMVSRKPSSISHIGLISSIILAATPWLGLLATIGALALFKLIRKINLGQLKHMNQKIQLLKLNLSPKTAMFSAAMATVTLTGASAYGLHQTGQNYSDQRHQIEHRILLQSGVKVNDNEANYPTPWRISNVELPLCEQSSAPVCIYKFGENNGGDNIVIPPSYLQDHSKMQQLGQSLFDQTKNSSNSVKIIIYTDRRAAQLVPQLTQNARGEVEMSQVDMDWSTSHYKAQFEGVVNGGNLDYAFLRYWPSNNSDYKEIEFGKKPAPTQSDLRFQKAVEQSSAQHIDYISGKVTAILANGFEVAGSKDPNSHYTVQVDAKTQYRLSGDVKINRSQIQVGSIVYTVGRHINGYTSPELARLVISDAGGVNTQGGIEFDWYGVDLKPYIAQLSSE